MNTKFATLIFLLFVIIGSSYCQDKSGKNKEKEIGYEISKPDSTWKSILSPDEFLVLREKGTEYAFTGKYNDFKEKGTFVCAGCGNELFHSSTKYNSGSGWPSFYKPINSKSVALVPDKSLGVTRTEVVCGKCGGHQGHVFEDGPQPTGLRYCVNSISMDFVEKESTKKTARK